MQSIKYKNTSVIFVPVVTLENIGKITCESSHGFFLFDWLAK